MKGEVTEELEAREAGHIPAVEWDTHQELEGLSFGQ